MSEHAASKPGDTTPVQHLTVPSFITINDVTPNGADEPEFVLTNEATGKYFKVNQMTVRFLDAIRRTGSLQLAFEETGIPSPLRDGLVMPLRAAGVLVAPGQTETSPAPKAPIEGKLISLRADVLDIEPFARAISGLARVLYTPVGYAAWAVVVGAALFQLLTHADKVAIGLRNIPDMGWSNALVFALLYVGIKIIHELGHASAYRVFCMRAGLEPGPIRAGIAVFAMTPFPFTDVTGAWRLRSRWQRAMIGAGGLYFETWTIALLTLLWANTQSGPVQTIILQVVIVTGLLTMFFNLNPAVKLDGYYILTDLIRRPNLAVRASQSARNLVVRLLGGQGSVDRFDLGYWIVSYLYRWTIFAGIFWLSYQFDPRLAPLVLGITLMMLLVRPVWSTIGYARKRNIRPWRSLVLLGGIAGLACLSIIPFPDRLLLHGNFETVDTRFVEPTETGIVRRQDGGLSLDSPSLRQQLADASLRAQMLANTARSVTVSATEQASLGEDISRLKRLETQLEARLANLDVILPQGAIWTPLDGEFFEDAWVTSATTRFGAISVPKPPELTLQLGQAFLEQDAKLVAGQVVKVRPVHNPQCLFFAELQSDASDIATREGFITTRATPVGLPDCAQSMRSGSAVVARMAVPAKSLVTRTRILASRLLQDRLPVNLN